MRLFTRVLAQAATYTNAHRAETAPLLAEASSIPLAVIEHMPRVTNGTRARPEDVQPVIDAAARYKTIKAPSPPARSSTPESEASRPHEISLLTIASAVSKISSAPLSMIARSTLYPDAVTISRSGNARTAEF